MIRERSTASLILKTLELLVDEVPDLLPVEVWPSLTVQIRYSNLIDRRKLLSNKHPWLLDRIEKEGPKIYNIISGGYDREYLLRTGISEKIKQDMEPKLARINTVYLYLKHYPHSFMYEIENCAPFGRTINLSVYDERRKRRRWRRPQLLCAI